MKIETVKLKKLVPDERNARLHNERNIAEIARSLQELGQHRPFVVQRGTNRVIVGNGMLRAALSLFVYVKCTYLAPCPHTPLAELPVNPEWCNIPGVFAEMNSRNKRIRVFPTRSAGRSAWRTALHRCTPEEALELPPEPKDTNVEESFRNFCAGLDGRGLGFLLDGSRKLNEAAIKTRIK